jgi:hypothetical protein
MNDNCKAEGEIAFKTIKTVLGKFKIPKFKWNEKMCNSNCIT